MKTHEGVGIKDSNIRAGVPSLKLDLVRRLVLKDTIHGFHILVDAIADFGDVTAFVGIELSRGQASCVGKGILRKQLKRGDIHEHEIPGSVLIQGVERTVNALDIVNDCLAFHLAVGEESIVAQVIGSDPDCIHCLGGRDIEEFLSSSRVDKLAISDEGRDLVFLD